MRNKLFLIFILGIMLLTTISALDDLGCWKVNTEYNFCQTCSDATYINLSTIQTPNTIEIINLQMTQNGTGNFCYNYTPTSIGRYDFRGISDGCEKTFATYLEVTQSGMCKINEGEGSSLTISIIVMLVISMFLFILGWKVESWALKLVIIGTAAVLLIATFLYSLVIVDQTLGGFSSIVEGYSTFWFVVQIILGITILALILFSLWAAWNFWMFKRGFRD